jgi:hypothetical protein
LINAHVNLRDDLVTGDIVQKRSKRLKTLLSAREPKVKKIFLEAARASESSEPDVVLEHMVDQQGFRLFW